MEYRHLGGSGLKISEIAYGNWITHGSQIEEDAARGCVRAALDEGISTFDTADVYAGGRAEEVLGRALAGVRRESVEIFTKVYWPLGDGPNNSGLSRKHITESLHNSLRRLGTDYVDLYQAHRYDHETPLEETLRAFDDLVTQGKVLYVGVSEWRAEEISAAMALPGQGAPSGSRATDASGSGFIKGYLTDGILARVQELLPVAKEAGLTMAQLAVAWVLQNPNVSTAIVGATRPEQVRENVQASGVELDEEIMRRIDDVLGPEIERDPALTRSPAHRPSPHPAPPVCSRFARAGPGGLPPGPANPPGGGSSGRTRP